MASAYDTLVSTSELLALLEDANTVILDCTYVLGSAGRGRQDYLKNHIPGAYYMDLGHDLSAPVIKGVTGRHPLPHPDSIAATLCAAGLDSGSQVIVYDQLNGAYASRAWWLLNWLGHSQVAVLNGGFAAWQKEGLPVDNQWPTPKQGNFQVKLNQGLLVDKEFVHNTHDTLVDSRAFERYTGEKEPLDPIAGHIEGASCLPFTENLREGGRWKTKAELTKRFSEASLLEVENPIFYCGSGVTACHNILAYKIATESDARLYSGSWSEWINYYPATIGA